MNKLLNVTIEDFRYIQKFVKEISGIHLEEDKTYLIESRLSHIIEGEKFPSFKELIFKLRNENFNGFHQKIIEAMTTNETSFFRDVHPFETFKNFILPEFIEKRKYEKNIKIWSAACSTGQEPYSIAMILNEKFGNVFGWNVNIKASDISAEMISRCKCGSYNCLEISRGLSNDMLERYFSKKENNWIIKDELKNMIDFFQMNLVSEWPFDNKIDVIFMRHVLIYFDIETRKNIMAKIKKIIKPDGYLILGVGETTYNIDEDFECVQIDKTSCYKLKT